MTRMIAYRTDIQNDFMNSNGRLYVPDAETIKPNIEAVTAFAAENGLQQIYGMDRHFATDAELKDNGGPFPWHCMDRQYAAGRNPDGTYGMDIIPQARGPQGIFLEKQHYDVFTNPQTERVLADLGVTDAIVDGVATDYCVKAAVLGMQERGIQTYVVADAIRGITPQGAAEALEAMQDAGAKMIRTQELPDLLR
ncbi:MAG: cysteine hydrolase family protein [Nanoarchaeota archaeon]